LHREIVISNEKEFQEWLERTLAHECERLAAESAGRETAAKNEFVPMEQSTGVRRRTGMNSKQSHRSALRFSRSGLAITGLLFWCFWNGPEAVNAQTPAAITDASTPIAMTTNNTGSDSTYVLNTDSSVSVVQTTGLLSGGGCGPILAGGGTVSNAAIAFDPSSNRLYAAIVGDSSSGTSLGTLLTYVTFSANGTCAPGATQQLATNNAASVELAVDSKQGNVYVLSSLEGVSLDILNPLSIAALGTYTITFTNGVAATLPQVYLDYSATYGPIVVDATTHRIYINDFGSATNLPPGLNPSPGFFVYDPTQSATASSNIQHVAGYLTTPTTTTLTAPFSAQALLVDNAGNLILVNQNTSISNNQGPTFQTTPFTILHTTAAGFSFFANTQPGTGGASSSVYIQPGASGISVYGPASSASILDFSAIGGADIDAVHGIIYRYTYNATSSNSYSATLVQDSGALVSFNLATLKDTLLTSNNLPLANLYPSTSTAAWNELTFDPGSNSVTLFTPGAVGVSNSLACNPISVAQVLGGGATFAQIGFPATNLTSGYVYDTQTVYPKTSLYYIAPPSTCVVASLDIAPSSLANGVAGQSYGPVAFSATGAISLAGLSFQASGLPSGMTMSPAGSLSGAPTQTGPFEVSVSAKDTEGDEGSVILPLNIICQNITVGPSQIPSVVQGVPYSLTFTQSGGIGNITFNAYGPFPSGISFNGNVLSGTTTQAGSFPFGVQVTDGNGCKSVNTQFTLNVVAHSFSIAPAPVTGSSQCTLAGPGFPIGVVPTVTINGTQYFQVQLNLVNNGNVAATANLTSALLRTFQPVNSSLPGLPGLPLSFNNPGTLFPPGACVSLSLYYPVTDFSSISIPIDGDTEVNVPQVLRLQGTFAATNLTPTYSGNWSLTDRQVELSTNICCNVSGGAAGTSGTPGVPATSLGTIPTP
jgi:hypothetical protein